MAGVAARAPAERAGSPPPGAKPWSTERTSLVSAGHGGNPGSPAPGRRRGAGGRPAALAPLSSRWAAPCAGSTLPGSPLPHPVAFRQLLGGARIIPLLGAWIGTDGPSQGYLTLSPFRKAVLLAAGINLASRTGMLRFLGSDIFSDRELLYLADGNTTTKIRTLHVVSFVS